MYAVCIYIYLVSFDWSVAVVSSVRVAENISESGHVTTAAMSTASAFW